MIVLVSPSNPTGTVYTNEEIKQWYDLAREYKVALVLDETYRDFVEGESRERGLPHRLFEEPDWRSTLVSLGSFSKGYRIPGHRLGSIIASPELLRHITTICDCMQVCLTYQFLELTCSLLSDRFVLLAHLKLLLSPFYQAFALIFSPRLCDSYIDAICLKPPSMLYRVGKSFLQADFSPMSSSPTTISMPQAF